MSGVEHAREMLIIAQRDFKALQGMLDAETFADEIFGFHAQQAVEKVLKAWLTLVGVEYPRTHDLEELLELLEEHAQPIFLEGVLRPGRSHRLCRAIPLSDFRGC